MKLRITTLVAGDYRSVMARFDRTLFEALKPPVGRVDLVQFDGSQRGDVVHVRLHLPLLPAQDWVSDIVEHGTDAQSAWFVDEGRILPFFLSYWRHIHRVVNKGAASEIVDDIEYRGRIFPSWLLWPVLWAQFAVRGPVYRRFFGTASPSLTS